MELRLVKMPMEQQSLRKPEQDACPQVPEAAFADERECLFKQCRCAFKFSPLRGHIAQFKQGCTQLTRIVSPPMSGNGFLEVRVGSAKITSFHRQSGTKQALASPQKDHASWVFERNVDVKPRLCCSCRRL